MKVLNKEIDMIVWFNPEGQIRPIRFRLLEEEENIVIEVNKVIYKTEEKISGKKVHTFKCQSLINGIEKAYELRYLSENLRWILFKM